MKLTKSMQYYFVSWLVGLLAISILNFFILDGNIESFLGLIGIGALIQLVFLSLRYVFLKISYKPIAHFANASCGELPKIIENNTDNATKAFALTFSDNKTLDGGKQ